MAEAIRVARLEDATGIAKVHVESWLTTYRGLIPDEYLARLSLERRVQIWKNILSNAERRTLEYVAEDEIGRVVGFVSGGQEREGDPVYTSELYAIYILAESQGRGIGRRLMQALVNGLVQNGATTLLLWVLSTNPSRHFYERMGGQEVKVKQEDFNGTLLEEVAYGWQDIRLLLDA